MKKQDSQMDKRRDKHDTNTGTALQTGTDWNAKRNRNIGTAVQTGADWNAKRNRNTGIAIQTGTDWNAKRECQQRTHHCYTDLAKIHYVKASQKQQATLINSPYQNGLPSCRTCRVIRVFHRQRISFFPLVELLLTPRWLVASLQSETGGCCKLARLKQDNSSTMMMTVYRA